jgi:hypothetical protein
MRALICLSALLWLSHSAAADWHINSSKNPMTDREDKIASVPSKAESHGILAFLQIECLPTIGGRIVSVVLSQAMTQGRIGLNFRIDDAPVEPRVLPVGTSLRSIALHGLDEKQLASAKRFRLQLFPAGGPELFYDFDVVGAGKAMTALSCKQHR